MTLQPLPSGFPCICRKFCFLFYQFNYIRYRCFKLGENETPLKDYRNRLQLLKLTQLLATGAEYSLPYQLLSESLQKFQDSRKEGWTIILEHPRLVAGPPSSVLDFISTSTYIVYRYTNSVYMFCTTKTETDVNF